ncbi:unnamed protein product [Penicillium olsonii]|nr:unnamed protein product [Penicillium olsonii]
MECLSARVPYAKWRLNAFRQLLVTSQPLTTHAVKRISTSRQNKMDESASKTSTETNDHVSIPDSIPPSQLLPQSPLIAHPRPAHDKSRKKRPSPADASPLRKNPWAVALASPIRMCTITGARLPSELLGTWGLVREPGTELSYMLPVGLMQDSLTSNKNQAPDASAIEEPSASQIQPQTAATKPQMPEDGSEAPEFTPPPIRNNRPGRQLVIRMTELLPTIQAITAPLSKKGGKKPPVMRLVPFRWKHPQGPVKPSQEKDLLWLENTPDILVRSMRNDVCKKLGAILAKYKRVGTPNGVWRALDIPQYSNAALEEALGKLEPVERMGDGCVLLLDSKSATDADSAQAERSVDSVALSQTGSNVPVFDLSVLLADTDLTSLRASHAQFEHNALFFRPEETLGVTAMIALWKMKRLLAGAEL